MQASEQFFFPEPLPSMLEFPEPTSSNKIFYNLEKNNHIHMNYVFMKSHEKNYQVPSVYDNINPAPRMSKTELAEVQAFIREFREAVADFIGVLRDVSEQNDREIEALKAIRSNLG